MKISCMCTLKSPLHTLKQLKRLNNWFASGGKVYVHIYRLRIFRYRASDPPFQPCRGGILFARET